MKKAFVLVHSILALLIFSMSAAQADQGSFSNAGGSTLVTSAAVSINSSVATPAGSLSVDCPVTSPGVCSGGTFSYVSNDGSLVLSGSFTSATFKETCWGGGRGGRVVCA